MTKQYQPLDLMVNGYDKRFLKSRFNKLYSEQVKTQIYNGRSLEDIKVALQLNKPKPDALQLSSSKIQSTDPFTYIDAISNTGNQESKYYHILAAYDVLVEEGGVVWK